MIAEINRIYPHGSMELETILLLAAGATLGIPALLHGYHAFRDWQLERRQLRRDLLPEDLGYQPDPIERPDPFDLQKIVLSFVLLVFLLSIPAFIGALELEGWWELLVTSFLLLVPLAFGQWRKANDPDEQSDEEPEFPREPDVPFNAYAGFFAGLLVVGMLTFVWWIA